MTRQGRKRPPGPDPRQGPGPRTSLWAVVGALVLLHAIVSVRCAWMADDAYITLRTVWNLLDGHGPVWNVGERVQAYTHPLWMALLTLACSITGEPYYTSIALNLTTTLAALLVFTTLIARTPREAILGLVLLVLSKAFVDFSTSGLENSLTHLLLMPFCWLVLTRQPAPKPFFALCLLACLAALNRIDSLLLFLPALCWWSWKVRSKRTLALAVWAFAPLLLWEAFSVLYYGSPVPNTAHAKLGAGWPQAVYLRQAFSYYRATLAQDPLTLAAIAGGLTLAFARRRADQGVLATGAALYLLYLLRIGGDFMLGRFFTAPFLIAAVLLSRSALAAGRWVWTSSLLVAVFLGLLSPYPTLFSDASYRIHERPTASIALRHGRVADERGYYYRDTGLLRVLSRRASPEQHSFSGLGTLARRDKVEVVVYDAVGLLGFYAGPEVYVLDLHALSCPLLARLPTRHDDEVRIGHLRRTPPEGHIPSLLFGDNRLSDPRLASLYDRIRLVTRAPLLAPGRLAAIWDLNFGTHADRIDATPDPTDPSRRRLAVYHTRMTPFSVSLDAIDIFPGAGIFPMTRGLQLYLESTSRPSQIELLMSNSTPYETIFFCADRTLASVILAPRMNIPPDALVTHRLDAPEAVRKAGMDALQIVPGPAELGWLARAYLID